MSLYDDNGNVSDLSWGLDTHAALNDQKSIFESFGDVITKGVPLTGLAVVNSFANTGIELANVFGADASKLSIRDEVGDGDWADYYDAHQQGIEAAALAAGSLIPGLAAIKALKLAQAGKFGASLARATGIFAGPQEKVVQGALDEIKNSGSLYNMLTADKIKAISLGFGDQALQALAYETATAATMKASPLLDNQSYTDMAENMFFGVLVGGGIGGALEGWATRGIFNKAVLAAEDSAKAQTLVNYLGKGGFGTGDRIATLLSSIDDIPAPSTRIQGKRFAQTYDNAVLNARKMVLDLVDKDDPAREDVAQSLFDTMLKMKQDGNMSKEDIYNYFSRLANVSRIDKVPVTDEPGAFYVNRFAKGQTPTVQHIVTDNPEDAADLSLRYRLKADSTDMRVARASEMVEANGLESPRWKGAQDAYDAGNDIYIGPKLDVHINPDAPNIERVARPGENRVLKLAEEKEFRKTGQLLEGSKPLHGASVILNTVSGAISERAEPVVGDFGKVSLFDKGLRYGDKTSLQSVGKVLDKDTPTIDANARYVWAKQRGILSGDAIEPTDIPMLEQLYREGVAESNGWQAYTDKITKKGVRINGMDMPKSAADLLGIIRESKDNFISQLIKGDSKLSSEEVALRAGVPESYISNGLKANTPDEFMISPEQHMKVNHVRLSYDIGHIYKGGDGNILKGMIDTQYRIQLIKDATDSASAKFLGKNFDQFKINATAADADIAGAGSGFLSFSNAKYGSLGAEAERVGRRVSALTQERIGQMSERLAQATQAIRQDEIAGAEGNFFTAVRRSTSESYQELPAALLAKYFPDLPQDGRMVAVLKSSLQKDKKGNVIDWDKEALPSGQFLKNNSNDITAATKETPSEKGLLNYYVLSPKVADFERANRDINNSRIIARNNFYAAQGLNKTLDLDTLYAPPIDTAKYNHFAYVRTRPGTGNEDSSPAVIVAKDAKSLEQKIGALRDDFEVLTKDQIKTLHEIKGDYEYSRNFAQRTVDSYMARRGILNDIFPATRSENYVQDFIQHHIRGETQLVRDYTELANAQLFEELRQMGQRISGPATSQTGFVGRLVGRFADNPFRSYLDVALNISAKEKYGYWADANNKLEAFFDTAFNTAKSAFISARNGVIDYDTASNMAQRFGLGNPYAAATDVIRNYYDVANKLPETKVLQRFVTAANSILGATVIRLDTMQQLIHVVSTPILLSSEARSVKDLLTTALPNGSGKVIPATSKVLYRAIANFFDKEGAYAQWNGVYRDIGSVRTQSADYFHEVVSNLTLPYGRFSESGLVANIRKAGDLAAKLTGAEWVEGFTSWIASDAGRQLFEGAGYSGKELTDRISSFVNRVKGNLIASQRPVAFQGPLGQAVGLFQTYQFNLFNQLLRYVENGEVKSLAYAAAMQQTLFGFQSLPGFHMLNNSIIGNAAGNPSHGDLYSANTSFFGKDIGNYLMYGAVSNVLGAGVYTRGDINPRQITLLPVNPLEFPAIAGGVRFLSDLVDTSAKIAKGGDVPASLLMGLEHNGLSRPLSGLAQLLQGYSTTSKGSLIAETRPQFGDNTAGLSDWVSTANFSRLLGARPLDEAVAMDAQYRSVLYQAKDTARMQALGEAVKSTLISGNTPSTDQVTSFAQEYADAGGHIGGFGRKILEWNQQANTSVANRVFRALKDPKAKNAMMIMGGEPLPDFSNLGSTATR